MSASPFRPLRMNVFWIVSLLLSGGIGALSANEPSDCDLPRFLPNGGNTVYEAPGLLKAWPEEGPKELWRTQVGWGKAAVAEAGGLAFTAAEIDEKQYGVCLDPADGSILWKHLLYPQANTHFTKGPVTSPVVDEDRVYFIPYAINSDVWDMICPIICVTTDGEELWRADQSFWGTEAATPLVVGDTLYVSADNTERVILVALNKRTGALKWSVAVEDNERGRELGAPASLTYQVVDGVPQIITTTYGTSEVLGVHAESGELMWRYPYPAPNRIGMVSTPVAIGDQLFVCAGEGQGRDFSALLQMKVEKGKIAFDEVYVSFELQNNMYNTVAIVDGAVYGFGGNKTAGFLHCTNLADGRLLWKEEGREWTCEQNLIVADGLILAINKESELVVAEASREGYRELRRMKLDIELGRPQQPLLANGRMYIRGMDTVICYQIAE